MQVLKDPRQDENLKAKCRNTTHTSQHYTSIVLLHVSISHILKITKPHFHTLNPSELPYLRETS